MMQWQASGPHNLSAFFHRNRTGCIGYVALFGFGFVFGHALFRAIYLESIQKAFLRSVALPPTLPLGSVMLSTFLPAILFLCCMLYCAYERLALPLWCLCPVFSGIRNGLCAGLLATLGFGWLIAWNTPLLLGQAALALLCLDIRRTQDGVDFLNTMERLFVPCAAYLIAASAIQFILLLRVASLTQGGLG